MKQILAISLAVVSLFVLLIIIILWPFAIIKSGHRGVVVELGRVQDKTLSEGFHVISPLQNVKVYDIRTQKIETKAGAASKDLQSVSATIAVNLHVNPDFVKSLYQETQGRYEETLVAPAIQESVKAATAQFTADELITKRQDVKEVMKSTLSARESMKFFIIEDVSIVNFSFSDSFNSAIEEKVQAEQEALAAKNKLEQVKYEAEQKVVAAQAEAESIKIRSEALANNQKLVELTAVEKWNGVLPSYMLGDSVPFLTIK